MHLESSLMIQAESTYDASAALRWGPERRMAYIEERLFWEGSINRADLINRFGC